MWKCVVRIASLMRAKTIITIVKILHKPKYAKLELPHTHTMLFAGGEVKIAHNLAQKIDLKEEDCKQNQFLSYSGTCT